MIMITQEGNFFGVSGTIILFSSVYSRYSCRLLIPEDADNLAGPEAEGEHGDEDGDGGQQQEEGRRLSALQYLHTGAYTDFSIRGGEGIQHSDLCLCEAKLPPPSPERVKIDFMHSVHAFIHLPPVKFSYPITLNISFKT